MDFLHRNKNRCEECQQGFGNYEELISHLKTAHNHHLPKCSACGKEFAHEKDRLHHVREENEKKTDARRHR